MLKCSFSSCQACQLPLFSYIVERLCACCYEQAWYAKLGGVVSIKFLMERLPLIWVLQNQLTFLKALLFVMMDLTGEVGTQSPSCTSRFLFLEHLLEDSACPCQIMPKVRHQLCFTQKVLLVVFLEPCLISSHSMYFHHKRVGSWQAKLDDLEPTICGLRILSPWQLELFPDFHL